MGVSTSKEAHQQIHTLVYKRGEKEIALLPLTPEFFPDHDHPLFRQLLQARVEDRTQYMYCRNSGLDNTDAGSLPEAQSFYERLLNSNATTNLLYTDNKLLQKASEGAPRACRPVSCAVAVVWDEEDFFKDESIRSRVHLLWGRYVEVIGYFGVRNTHPLVQPGCVYHTMGMYWTKAAGDHLTSHVMKLASRCYVDQCDAVFGPGMARTKAYFPEVWYTTLENNLPVLRATVTFATSFSYLLTDDASTGHHISVQRPNESTHSYEVKIGEGIVRDSVYAMADSLVPAHLAECRTHAEKARAEKHGKRWAVHLSRGDPLHLTSSGPAGAHNDGPMTSQGNASQTTLPTDVVQLQEHTNELSQLWSEVRALSREDLIREGKRVTKGCELTSTVLIEKRSSISNRILNFIVPLDDASLCGVGNAAPSRTSDSAACPTMVKPPDVRINHPYTPVTSFIHAAPAPPLHQQPPPPPPPQQQRAHHQLLHHQHHHYHYRHYHCIANKQDWQ